MVFRLGVLALCCAAMAGTAAGQTPSLSITPPRLETEIPAGAEKTVSFEIGIPAAAERVTGRLLLSLTDWNIKEDGSMGYGEPGTLDRSASSWVTFSPSAFTAASGQRQLVRLTIKTPPGIEPGVYRSAIFIQGRPSAAPPKNDTGVIFVRLRYAVSLLVVIPPVSSHPSLADVAVEVTAPRIRLVCTLNNSGTAHVRPVVRWTIKGAGGDLLSEGRRDATLLLPSSTLREPYALSDVLAPGAYEMSVVVDFRDGQPLQAMSRRFDVAAGP